MQGGSRVRPSSASQSTCGVCVCVCIAELCLPAIHLCVKSFSLTDEMNVAEASVDVHSEGCRCSTEHGSFHILAVKAMKLPAIIAADNC